MSDSKRRIRNWEKYQHYQTGKNAKACPEWIKLYPRLLNDYEYSQLEDRSRIILIELFMLASEFGGALPPLGAICFRLRRHEKEVRAVLDKLPHWIETEITDPRSILGMSYDSPRPEEKRIEEKRIEENVISREKTKEGFQREHEFMKTFWPKYPHKVGKGEARNAFRKAREKVEMAELMAGVENYIRWKPKDQQWCNPATWLNQERWTDEPAASNAITLKTNGADRGPDSWGAVQHEYREKYGAEAFKVYCQEREKQ